MVAVAVATVTAKVTATAGDVLTVAAVAATDIVVTAVMVVVVVVVVVVTAAAMESRWTRSQQ